MENFEINDYFYEQNILKKSKEILFEFKVFTVRVA